jgi:hypothetical protein
VLRADQPLPYSLAYVDKLSSCVTSVCPGQYLKNAVRYTITIFFYIAAEPGYNDIGLYVTSLIALDILWYQLIP